MLLTLAQFVTRNTGKWRDFDGAFGAQCVDLVQLYLRDVLGDPPLGGNAINEYGEDSPHWTWIRIHHVKVQRPAKGDVIIWGPDARIGTGVYGHTAVVLESDLNGFTSFDQNWPLRAPCHQVRHSYFGVIGWGVPKAKPVVVKPAPPPSPVPAHVSAPVPPVTPPQEPPVQNPPVNATPAQPPDPLPPIAPDPPVVITVPDVPEPPVIAEQGVTTSEWKLAITFLAQLAAAGTATVAAKVGLHLDSATINTIVEFEVLGGFAAAAYVLSRGIRKIGAS